MACCCFYPYAAATAQLMVLMFFFVAVDSPTKAFSAVLSLPFCSVNPSSSFFKIFSSPKEPLFAASSLSSELPFLSKCCSCLVAVSVWELLLLFDVFAAVRLTCCDVASCQDVGAVGLRLKRLVVAMFFCYWDDIIAGKSLLSIGCYLKLDCKSSPEVLFPPSLLLFSFCFCSPKPQAHLLLLQNPPFPLAQLSFSAQPPLFLAASPSKPSLSFLSSFLDFSVPSRFPLFLAGTLFRFSFPLPVLPLSSWPSLFVLVPQKSPPSNSFSSPLIPYFSLH